MARKLRVEYKGCLYHVMVRGNNGEFILQKEEEKQIYLDLIKKYKERYPFKLYAYCIMDNHVHMLIEQEDIPLSKIMQGIQQSFTQRYNKKFSRTGHVFQQRYKAQICNKEKYILQLVKYIHRNPEKAEKGEGLNYRWSSHKEYITNIRSELIEKDNILKVFSGDKKRAISDYKNFMNIKDKEDNDDIEEYLLIEAQSKKEDIKDKIEIDKIIDRICDLEKVELNEITKRSKVQRYSDIRKAIVLASEKHADVTNTELAKKLNIPLSMISKIKSGASKRTAYVDKIMEKFENKGIFQA